MTYREKRVESALLPDLPVLSFDTAAAWRYGELRAEREREGTPIGDAGMRTTEIARARGGELVARIVVGGILVLDEGDTAHEPRCFRRPFENEPSTEAACRNLL